MSALICDICGGNLVMDASGETAVCESCGMKHSKDRVKVKVQEIKGIVDVTKGEAEKERLLKNGKIFVSSQDFEKAKKVYDNLLFDYPDDKNVKQDYEDFIYETKSEECKYKIDNIINFLVKNMENIIPPNDLMDILKIESEYNSYDYRTDEFKETINRYYENFKYNLNNMVVRKQDITISWDIKCKEKYTGLPENFINWLYFDTQLFVGIFAKLKYLQKCATNYYYRLILEGKTSPTSCGRDCIYPKKYEIFDEICETQFLSVFGIDATKEYKDFPSVPLKNIFLRELFFKGKENAKNLNKIRSTTNYEFYLGKYFFERDGYSSDYGPPYSYRIGNSSYDDILVWIEKQYCQYCGGEFKGIFKKVCSKCGKPKDY